MTLSLANSVEDVEPGCSGCNTHSDSESESSNKFRFSDFKDVKLMTGHPAANIAFTNSPYATIGDTFNIRIGTANIDGQEFKNITSFNNQIPCENNAQITSSQETKTKDKEVKNGLEYLKHLLAQRSTQFFLLGIILSITTITSLIMFFYFYNFTHDTAVSHTFGHNDNLGDGIQVIHREEWLARPPLNTTPITAPLKMVRILHTSGFNCSDYQTCANKILGLQGLHVGSDGLPDIAYNFLIGGDGNVYLGRGAEVSNDQRPDAYDVAYVGNYLEPYDQVSDKMDKAGRRLIQRLLERGKLEKDYVVVAYNQTERVNSPGENVFKRVVLWPHYKSGKYFV